MRLQAERENEAYVQHLEIEKNNQVLFAAQEDARMRQSSFGPMPVVSIYCPGEVQDRLGLSMGTTSFSSSANQPFPVEKPRRSLHTPRR